MFPFMGNCIKFLQSFDRAIFKYFNAVCHKMDNYIKSVKKPW